jgi:hypothetical protein
MYAGFAEKFGDRAMTVLWESYAAVDEGADGTFGSLSLFNNGRTGYRSSMIKVPSAVYWALYAAQNLWIDPAKDNSVVSASLDTSGDIRAYGCATADDFRVLLFNFSTVTDSVSCEFTGGDFDSVNVYAWGETQFT